jgi:hypothetical protein
MFVVLTPVAPFARYRTVSGALASLLILALTCIANFAGTALGMASTVALGQVLVNFSAYGVVYCIYPSAKAAVVVVNFMMVDKC